MKSAARRKGTPEKFSELRTFPEGARNSPAQKHPGSGFPWCFTFFVEESALVWFKEY